MVRQVPQRKGKGASVTPGFWTAEEKLRIFQANTVFDADNKDAKGNDVYLMQTLHRLGNSIRHTHRVKTIKRNSGIE